MILNPVEKGKITQPFGVNGKFYLANFGVVGHNGVDIVSFHGDKIYAPEDGIVFKVYDLTHGSVTKGFGVHLITKPINGLCRVHILWHMMSNLCVKDGDEVKQGDILGYEGASGAVFENGVAVPDDKKGVPPYPGTHCHWGELIVKQTIQPSLNFCLAGMGGKQYQDSEGFFYEIQNYANGFRGCVDPMTPDVVDYDVWLTQKAVETAIVATNLIPEIPEPQKTTLGQAIINLLLKVASFLEKL